MVFILKWDYSFFAIPVARKFITLAAAISVLRAEDERKAARVSFQ
jgi:hypothetical protein